MYDINSIFRYLKFNFVITAIAADWVKNKRKGDMYERCRKERNHC